MPSFRKSQYISALFLPAGMPDLLSLKPVVPTRCLNPLVSSSHIFHHAYKPNQRTLQQFNGTSTMVVGREPLGPWHATASLAHSSCRFHTCEFMGTVPTRVVEPAAQAREHRLPAAQGGVGATFKIWASAFFFGVGLSLRLTGTGVGGIISLGGPCGPGGDAP
jgi:hypothetical protein